MKATDRLIRGWIWEDDCFSALPLPVRYLYLSLIGHADYEGRLKGDIRSLKRHIFFSDAKIAEKKIENYVQMLVIRELIVRYDTPKGVFIQVLGWEKLQSLRKDRAKPSDYPAPPSDTWQPKDGQLTPEGKVREGKGSEEKRIEEKSSFSSVRDQGPTHIGSTLQDSPGLSAMRRAYEDSRGKTTSVEAPLN